MTWHLYIGLSLLLALAIFIASFQYRIWKIKKYGDSRYPWHLRGLMKEQPSHVHEFNIADLPITVCKRSRSRSEDKQKRDG